MESQEDQIMGVKIDSPEVFDNFFEKYDTNGDGVISRDEIREFLKNIISQSLK
jgi:Ca2+-binding EF-hand superfamily protein